MSSPVQKLNLNLVHWSDFRSGSFADLSGNAHTVTPAGSPAFTNDGILLDGVADYVSIADAADLSFGDSSTDSPFSLAAWINMNDASSFKIISKGIRGTDGEYEFSISASGLLLILTTDESVVGNVWIGRSYSVALTPFEGQWIHVCATYSGSGTSAGFKLFLNGEQVDDGDVETGAYTAMENLTANVHIGENDGTFSDGKIQDAIIINKELTASEITELMQKTNDLTWNTNPSSKRKADVRGSFGDSSLLLDAVMEPINGKIIDRAGGASGTISGTPIFSETILGKSATFDKILADQQINFGNLAATNFQRNEPFSCEAWVKNMGTSNFNFILNTQNATSQGWVFRVNNDGKVLFGLGKTGESCNNVAVTDVSGRDYWTHVMCTYDGSSSPSGIKLYVDGVDDGSSSVIDTLVSDIPTDGNLRIAQRDSGGVRLDGGVLAPKIWSGVKSANFVRNRYLLGASAVEFKTDFGIYESTANVTSGQLENSPFENTTGTHKVEMDTHNGNIVKVIKAVVGGTLTLTGEAFNDDNWEIWRSIGGSYIKIPSGLMAGNVLTTTTDYKFILASRNGDFAITKYLGAQ